MHYEVDCYQLLQAGLKHKQVGTHCFKAPFVLFMWILTFLGWLPDITTPWSRISTYLKWENTKLLKINLGIIHFLVYIFPEKDIKAPLFAITFVC